MVNFFQVTNKTTVDANDQITYDQVSRWQLFSIFNGSVWIFIYEIYISESVSLSFVVGSFPSFVFSHLSIVRSSTFTGFQLFFLCDKAFDSTSCRLMNLIETDVHLGLIIQISECLFSSWAVSFQFLFCFKVWCFCSYCAQKKT